MYNNDEDPTSAVFDVRASSKDKICAIAHLLAHNLISASPAKKISRDDDWKKIFFGIVLFILSLVKF